jgi:hypothetical protein
MGISEIGLVCGLDSSGSEQGLVVDPCEYGNESSGSVKDR